MPLIDPLRERFDLPSLSLQELQSEVTQRAGQILAVAGAFAGKLAQGGFALFNLLALLFLTPVVTFYLLRDWAAARRRHRRSPAARPRRQSASWRGDRMRRSPATCAARRWSASALGSIYAIGLSLVGLQFGLIIGLIAGAISFIPFVGTLVGAVMALGMALVQFPPDWIGVRQSGLGGLPVGQILEGNVLSRRAGRRPRRPAPVWMMFALLAGGALFGFVGVLIAVPVAAVIGVIVRHLLGRYRESGYYRGGDPA